jgi:hypothetical protein
MFGITPSGYRGDLYHLGGEQPFVPRQESVSTIAVSGNSVRFALDTPTPASLDSHGPTSI